MRLRGKLKNLLKGIVLRLKIVIEIESEFIFPHIFAVRRIGIG